LSGNAARLDQKMRQMGQRVATPNMKVVWRSRRPRGGEWFAHKLRGSIYNNASILGAGLPVTSPPYAISKDGVVQIDKVAGA